MASPFFVGPKEGEFPGKPIPGGGGRFSGMLNEFQSPNLGIDFSKSGGLFGGVYKTFFGSDPRGLWDGFVAEFSGDIESSLKVPGGYKSRRSGAPTVEELEDQYEKNQLPGARDPSVSLKGLLTDPITTFWEEIKEGINLEDIERRQKAAFVTRMMTGAHTTEITELIARDAFAKRTFASSPLNNRNDPIDGLRLTGRGVFKAGTVNTFGGAKKAVQVDAYKEVAHSITDLTLNIDSAVLRRSKHNKFLMKSSDAVFASLDQIKNDSTRWNTLMSKLSPADQRNAEIAFDGFMFRKKVADSMDSLSGALGTTPVNNMGANFGKYFMSQDVEAITALEGNFAAMQAQLKASRDAIADTKQFYKLNGSPDLIRSFEASIAKYEKVLNRLEKNLTVDLAADGSLTNFFKRAKTGVVAGSNILPDPILRAQADIFQFRYGEISRLLEGRDFFQQGARREFLTDLIENEFLFKKDTRALGTLIHLTDDDGLKALFPWVNRMREDRLRHSTDDFVKLFDKGKLTSTYIYSNRIKKRFANFTVSNFIEDALGKLHYFGLKIDEDYLNTPGDQKFFLYRIENWVLKNTPAVLLITNRIKMNIEGIGTIRTVGGKHLKGAVFFAKQFFHADPAQKLDRAAVMSMLTSPDLADFTSKFSNFARGDLDKSIAAAYDEIQLFKTWLMKYNHILGIFDAHGNIVNFDKLEKFLSWVHNRVSGANRIDYIPLDRAYAGLVEKFGQWINTSQSFILKHGHWVIAPVVNIKSAIAEKVADAVSWLVAKLVTVGTEGAGVFIDKAVRIVTRFLVLKAFQAVDAIRKGEWSKFVYATGQLALKSFTFVAYLLVLPGFFLLLGTKGLSYITAAIPADNPTKVTGLAGGGGTLNPLPPGQQNGSCVGQVVEGLTCVMNSGYGPTPDAGSYTPGTGGRGHGTNVYWDYVGGSCKFAIPYLPDAGVTGGGCPGSSEAACGPSNDAASYCSSRAPTRSYYGYAMDVVASGDTSIYLPTIEGVNSWTVHRGLGTDVVGGNMLMAEADVEDGGRVTARYKILYLHLGTICVNPGVYPAGQKITSGYRGYAHTHVELSVSYDGVTWEPLPPEDYIGCSGF